jgi:hypothetical protein
MSRKKGGYGNPPAEHRFKPGRSGNPRGRPRKKRPETPKMAEKSFHGQLEQELSRKLTLMENGEPIELPASQAIARAMIATALKGSRLAQAKLYKIKTEQEEKAAEQAREHYVWCLTQKYKGEAAMKAAQEQGLPAPELYPHPEDIIVDPTSWRARVLGPVAAEDMVMFRPVLLWRDLLLAFYAGLTRGKFSVDPAKRSDYEIACLCMVKLLTPVIPPSRRYSELDAFGYIRTWQDLGSRQYDSDLAALARQIQELPPSPMSQLDELDEQHAALFDLFDDLVKH